MNSAYLQKLLHSVRNRYIVRLILNLLFIGGVAFITYKVTQGSDIDEFLDHTPAIVLFVVAIILWGFSFIITSLLVSKSVIQEIIEAPANFYELTVTDTSTGEVDKKLNHSLDKLTEDEIRFYSVYHRSIRAMGLTWIVADIIFVLGIIVVFIEGKPLYLIAFIVPTITIFILQRVKPKKIKIQMDEIKKANRW